MEFGMYCTQTGAHREATCATQALDMWDNCPRGDGETWCLVIDGVVVKEATLIGDCPKWGGK